jgi:ABC-2 type transport system permease protein
VLLTVPSGFTQSLMEGKPAQVQLLKQPNNAETVVAEEAVKSEMQQLNAAVNIAQGSVSAAEQKRPFTSAEEKQGYYQRSLDAAFKALQDPPTHTVLTAGAVDSSTLTPDGFSQSSAGQLVTWVLVTLLGGSEVFVNERLGGTLRRLMITPTQKGVILCGKILARFVMGLLQMVILISFGRFVLGIPYGHSFGALALMVVSFGLAGTAMGVMLGAFARTSSQASSLTTLFAMLLAALGGAWWPLEVTPAAYQSAVKLIPTSWAMVGFQNIITRGQGLESVLLPAGLLLAFALVFFSVGLWKLKFE